LNTRNIIQSDFGLELFYSQLLYTCVRFWKMTGFLNDTVYSLVYLSSPYLSISNVDSFPLPFLR
jgi:hypothetical protein